MLLKAIIRWKAKRAVLRSHCINDYAYNPKDSHNDGYDWRENVTCGQSLASFTSDARTPSEHRKLDTWATA